MPKIVSCRSLTRISVALAAVALFSGAAARAQSEAPDNQDSPVDCNDDKYFADLSTWLDCQVRREQLQRIAIQAGVRSNRNQVEAPAMSGNTTSLVDTSSASDLISMAANIAGLSDGSKDSEEEDGTSASATASAYVLYSAVSRKDPLAPEMYCQPGAQWWRSFWVTLGFDDQDNDSSDSSDNPVVVGAKFRPPLGEWNSFFRSDVCDWNTKPRFAALRDKLKTNLDRASEAFVEVAREVAEELAPLGKGLTPCDNAMTSMRPNLLKALEFEEIAIERDKLGENPTPEELEEADRRAVERVQDLANNHPEQIEQKARVLVVEEEIKEDNEVTCLQAIVQHKKTEAQTLVDGAVLARLNSFSELDTSIDEVIEELNGQADTAVTFITKQRSDGADQYSSGLVFEYALFADSVDFTLNASHEYKDEMTGDDNHGGRVAISFETQPFPDLRFAGPKPFRLSLAAEGEWMQGEKPLYKGQLKLVLPIPAVDFLSGLEIPLSLTIANRTDVIDETDVRGMIGFTLDTAQVLAEARRRLAAQLTD